MQDDMMLFARLLLGNLLVVCLTTSVMADEGARRETIIRVALVQYDAVPEKTQRNLDGMERIVRKAVTEGARLIVFHEATLTDYTPKVEDLSESVPDGPACSRIGALAKELDCYISFGLSERDGDRRYITQVFMGPEGLVHRYRMTWLYFTPDDVGYRNEWARYDPGEGPELFEIDGISTVCIICADGVAGRAVDRLEALKPELVIYPSNRIVLPGFPEFGHLASRIGAPLLATNRVGRSWFFDFLGGTVVYGSDGAVLAESNRMAKEEVLVYDLVVPSRGRKESRGVAQTIASSSKIEDVRDIELAWVFSKPAGLRLTRSEITVAQYRACVEAGACDSSSHRSKSDRERCNWGHQDRDDHPMNCVNWSGANQFCEWVDGRLPTTKDWEAEATDNGSREYPWGNDDVTCDRCIRDEGGNGCGKEHTWPVCSRPQGNSVSGLCDMAGNVEEWTSSPYPSTEIFASNDETMALKGGAWLYDNPGFFMAALSFPGNSHYSYSGLGFRCVQPSSPSDLSH
jgi:formylglycine-generating enzyme